MNATLVHWRRRLSPTPLFIAILATLWPILATGQLPARELLNSERIAAEFGSYGIEVLAQDAKLRVSNLYSSESGTRICRTFAVVKYAPSIDPALAVEHAAVVAGGSLGAVFAARGWQVHKTNLYYGQVRASPRLAKLMSVTPESVLAAHVYALDVTRDGRVFEYAALVEIHHPDYLRLDELEAIYGAISAERTELVTALLGSAAELSR
jgi:hypothetical protein